MNHPKGHACACMTGAYKALLLPCVYTIKLHPSCWNKNSGVSPKISSPCWMDWFLAQEFRERFGRQISKHCGGWEEWFVALGQTAGAASEPCWNAAEIIVYL